ncbi:MAG: hypothetical protein E6J72_09400 [Deltaproteobacteria bacterium]|nr:MAG: hypothetical protein E6J72_09400 [Deltaproteobacteria bacterium]
MNVEGVGVVDAFRSSTVEVKKPKFFCAPTNKNNEDPTAPSHPDHLTDFSTKTAKLPPAALGQHFLDQFGSLILDVRGPLTLQVPSEKSTTGTPPTPAAPGVDHFQCYSVRTPAGAARFLPVSGVTIQDQFGSMTVDVKRPTRVCAPADKNNEAPGAETHADHLLCYKIKQTSLPRFARVTGLFVNHQFGPERLDAKVPKELCVPALRNVTSPTPTVTATTHNPTATPTPTLTGLTPTRTPTPVSTACVLPNPLPEVLSFVAKPGVDLDTGWTGQSHDLPGIDNAASAAVRLSNCDTNTSSPTCGQCDVDGPVLFPGPSKNCRCFHLSDPDSSSLAVCDPEMPSSCTSPETCECFYGPPLPLSSGAVSVCVTNRYTSSVSGTANIADNGPHAGEGTAIIKLESAVHNGPTVDQPCPVCVNDPTPEDGVKGGTCSSGPKQGQPCDVSGTNHFFGAMSFDCIPAHAANIGNLAIRFNPATTATTTLATQGLKCTAPGFTTADCPCDTCASAAAEPCSTNADCLGGAVCGGKRCIGGANNGTACAATSECPSGSCGRPGQATAPNQCSDGVCSPDSSNPATPNDGVCDAGPFDQFCSTESFRGCASDTDCNPPPSGNCGTCKPNQVCTGGFRNCFLDPIVRSGTPGTQNSVLAATFCIPPVSAGAINGVTGLPGPGALLQPVAIFRSGAQCGNGVLNSGETCDPPNDSACPGACLPNCQCPTCGDNHVNQPSEQCDGTDDANCPGNCQANCQCGGSCGNNVVDFGEQCDGTATNGQCPASACQSDCTCGPYCGNDVVDAGEQCDGSAGNGQCPASACQANCTCGPYCGDGTINGSEQCDGSATGSCPGSCQPDCTCAPFCGNGVREAGELCDGSDAALCPGQCQADCTCPPIGELSFVVTPGADLDTGWTGTSHDFGVQAGSTIAGVIGACDGITDTECTFFANVGSHCSSDGSVSCTDTTQCPVGQTCVIETYGPPLPLSSGGIPVCVVNRFAGDVTGTYDTSNGNSEITVPLNSLVYLGTDVNRPCAICQCSNQSDPQNCAIGDTGTCSDNPTRSCTVEGTGPLGPTSNDCPPNPASNISGGGLNLAFAPATTFTKTFASNQACTGSGFTNQQCWCSGETQPNACLNACNGGDHDAQPCTTNADCAGNTSGVCVPLCRSIAGQTRPGQGVQATGEAECVAGPFDQSCSGAPQVSCTSDANCVGLGTCVTSTRRCFLDPIVRTGTPGTSTDVLASTFCIPATTSPAVNNTAGLPGPGAIRFPNSVDAKYCGDGVKNRPQEQCDGNDATACPGQCLPNCTCNTACGNNVVEVGEQCDGSGQAQCGPGQTCLPPGDPAECTCSPAVCGDGFKAPSEQCDPGGPGGTPLPSDAACPGHCLATCTCQPPVCGNGVIEAGEVCELPQTGCGPLQICVACTQCAP